MNTARRIASWLLVALLVLLLTLAAAAVAQAQDRRWPDRAQLVTLADSMGIDARAMLAIAWEESAANLDPKVRGHHCWFSRVIDSSLTIVHHERDCEVGRFQIKPSTARRRCPELNVFTYAGNTRCFALMFAVDSWRVDRLFAIRNHNGTGSKADAYQKRVLLTIGWLIMTEDLR